MNAQRLTIGFALLTLGSALATTSLAGQPQKWEDLPEPVRATVLAHGGVAGQQVDKENGVKNGMAIYEAGVKDKNGEITDLVMTADGKLRESKHDDSTDLAGERA